MLKLAIAAFFHAIWAATFAYAIHKSSIAHVFILNTLDVCFIVLFKLIQRAKLSKLELAGILITILILFLVFFDRTNYEIYKYIDFPTSLDEFLGCWIALLGSFAAGVYFQTCCEITEDYPYWMGIFIISLLDSVFQLLISLIFEGATFSMDQTNGLFGVFSGHWFLYHIFISLIVGIGSFCCLNVLSRTLVKFHYHFALSLEPLIATLFAFFLNLQSLPSPLIWVALGLYIFMMGLISMGKSDSETQEIEFEGYFQMEEEDKNAKRRRKSSIEDSQNLIEIQLINMAKEAGKKK